MQGKNIGYDVKRIGESWNYSTLEDLEVDVTWGPRTRLSTTDNGRDPDDSPELASLYPNTSKILHRRECDLGENENSFPLLDLNLCENKRGKLVVMDK
jgi:hypothetical protein